MCSLPSTHCSLRSFCVVAVRELQRQPATLRKKELQSKDVWPVGAFEKVAHGACRRHPRGRAAGWAEGPACSPKNAATGARCGRQPPARSAQWPHGRSHAAHNTQKSEGETVIPGRRRGAADDERGGADARIATTIDRVTAKPRGRGGYAMPSRVPLAVEAAAAPSMPRLSRCLPSSVSAVAATCPADMPACSTCHS